MQMKMKIEKFLESIIVALAFCVSLCVIAQAVEVDGICRNREWENAEVFILKEQRNFGNGVKSAVAKAEYSYDDGCVYIAVMSEFQKDGNMEDGAVKLRINDGNEAVINFENGVTDDGGYEIEALSTWDSASGCSSTEISVRFTDSLTSDDVFMLNIVDLQGVESNTFTFCIENEDGADEQTEQSSQKEKTSKSKTVKNKKSSLKKTSSKKKKTSAADDFTFKKAERGNKTAAEKSAKNRTASANESEETYAEAENQHNSRYAYAAAGTLCALAIAVAAVVCAMKSNEDKNKE